MRKPMARCDERMLRWMSAGILSLSFAMAATAGEVDADSAQRLQEEGRILPLAEVVARARSLHPGSVIEVELDDNEGRYVYEIELLDVEGTSRELYFDAGSGELLDTKQDD